MTKPTLTYGHGFLDDGYDASGWSLFENYLSAILTVEIGDILKIEGTPTSSGDEYVSYRKNITNISSDIYPKFLIRYKTSHAQKGLAAKVKLLFTDNTMQTLLDNSFSINWTTVSGEITPGKTISYVYIYADDVPDSIASGTYQVYYDFILLHKGTFTFPAITKGTELSLQNIYADLEIPGRVGSVTQFLGQSSPTIRLTGSMENWQNWGVSPKYGEPLFKALLEMHKDPWQWFTSDLINCKVTVRSFGPSKRAASRTQREWTLELKKYDLSSGNETLWDNLSWLGL